MINEANRSVVWEYLEAWGEGDTATLQKHLDADAITHVSAAGAEPSVEFEIYACETWFASFPDTVFVIEKLITENDHVSAYWTITATHTAEFIGIPATGKRVQFGGFEIHRLVDGKIVEIWRLSDTMNLMEQLNAG